MKPVRDNWAEGDSYEPYIGRWSRLVARELLAWLDLPPGLRWLDAGCGTGALGHTVLESAAPLSVTGCDRSHGFLLTARRRAAGAALRVAAADAQALPFRTGTFDAALSGLVLNFVPEPARMVAEMARVLRPGGRLALYVWDYAGGMELLRRFWDAAAELDPAAAERDEGRRFPLCEPGRLRALIEPQPVDDVAVRALDVPTVFRDFDDFWLPFLGGQGPAPSYVAALDTESRSALRELLRRRLPPGPDGAIALVARAWAVTARRSGRPAAAAPS